MTIEEHRIELPSGQIIDDWVWIDTPDFVNVVVQTVEDDYLVFQQTKYAVEGTTLAIVGGYVDPGEDPATAAHREVLEETGWVCAHLHPLGSYAIDGNRGAGTGHLFLATGAHPAEPTVAASVPDSDDLEEQELLRLSRSELQAALLAGEFKVVSWSAAVAMSLVLS